MAFALLGRVNPDLRDRNGLTAPRGHLFDEMFTRRYDEALLDESGKALMRRIPSWLRIAAEVQRRSDEYDVVVSWSERVTLALMAMQALSRRRKPHVAMMYWFSKPATRAAMRAFFQDTLGK